MSHNAYLQILCECGLPALLLFLGAIGVGGLAPRAYPPGDPACRGSRSTPACSRSRSLAYLVGSMFLNTAYSELLYQLIAMSVSLAVVARSEAAAESGAPRRPCGRGRALVEAPAPPLRRPRRPWEEGLTMCGIAGLFHLRPGLRRRARARRWRAWWRPCATAGRTTRGSTSPAPIGLGHARLSIIDLAGGHQPIFNEDRTVAVVCNGEIYNHRELRQRAGGAGAPLRHRAPTPR